MRNLNTGIREEYETEIFFGHKDHLDRFLNCIAVKVQQLSVDVSREKSNSVNNLTEKEIALFTTLDRFIVDNLKTFNFSGILEEDKILIPPLETKLYLSFFNQDSKAFVSCLHLMLAIIILDAEIFLETKKLITTESPEKIQQRLDEIFSKSEIDNLKKKFIFTLYLLTTGEFEDGSELKLLNLFKEICLLIPASKKDFLYTKTTYQKH